MVLILTPTASAIANRKALPEQASSDKTSRFLEAFPYLMLACFCLLIFWGVKGMLYFEPDDYSQTAYYFAPPFPTNFSEYVRFVCADRGFLHWAYHAIHEVAGHSFDAPVCFFCGLFGASSLYLYYVLRRFTSRPSALIGALLYLCLSSKYRAITAYNAELYIPIVISTIVFLHVMTSRLPRIAQCAIVTPIFWLTLHFYEILIVLVPIFSCAWLAPSLRRKKLPDFGDITCALLPWLVTLFHLSLLSTSKSPIWQRHDHTSLTNLPHDLWTLFCLSLDQNFGSVHWRRISTYPINFFKFDLHADHFLWIPTIAISVCAVLALWIVWSKDRGAAASEAADPNHRVFQKAMTTNFAVFAVGMYLALFSSLVAIGEFTREVPSRLLLLPGLGYGLALATGLQLVRKHWSFRPLFTMALAWCIVESLTFANIIQQHISLFQVDQQITEKIVALKWFNLEQRHKLFISLPYTNKKGTYWLEEEPSYYSCFPLLLWSHYRLPFSNGTYEYAMRNVNSLQATGMYVWLTRELKHSNPSDLCTFYLDDKGDLRPITKVKVVTLRDGKVIPKVEYKTALCNMIGSNSASQMLLIPEPTMPGH